jgi:hypothetical protein
MSPKLTFVVCINNKDYPASLEMRKIYRVLPDSEAESHRMIRVIDESGEDYLFPDQMFAPVELPKVAMEAFAVAAS